MAKLPRGNVREFANGPVVWFTCSLALMALGFAVLATVAVAIVFLINNQGRLKNAVQSAFDFQSRLERVLSDLLDAETGQRGYLLTGEEPTSSHTSVPYRRSTATWKTSPAPSRPSRRNARRSLRCAKTQPRRWRSFGGPSISAATGR
jgi:hypothetical protein